MVAFAKTLSSFEAKDMLGTLIAAVQRKCDNARAVENDCVQTACSTTGDALHDSLDWLEKAQAQ